ncbi:aminotransferase class V-fold PLP-dependent enzyme [Aquicella lusitana]|uniref:Selenocysteine lyase/cysteine desulfurase n=1 Tax=Aquicella lusitana TaxID=254246 RepID=A0A370G5M0_9COXI|nr:aminotransferase class V-fold PLP-dependent enzyme [Aquicella lusitana]RDI39055.1 selenocysteine lyase/cysteine desulfurase [Aquicella lusitana]VVC73662.1 Cysteine desulfurase SufS [Aquicella lusitana]
MPTFPIKKLREETPGCREVLHFNNAGAALPPRAVIDAVKEHIDLEATIGGYEAASVSFDKTEQMYEHAAQLIHCDRSEIAFVENATRAWDMAFYSFKFKKGDRIITALSEYASNYLAFLHAARHTGVSIDVVRNDDSGQLDLDDLEKKLDERVKLIAITHIPSQGGLINPATEVGRMANAMGIPYLLDATQSVGQLPIDVRAIGCDFLCTTGRKFLRGPRGTGFLYARKSRLEQCDPPFIDLQAAKWVSDNDYVFRPDARRFECWEQNIAAKIGLSTAIQYALQIGPDQIWERIHYLSQRLRQRLSEISGITLRDLGQKKCGIVTFTSDRQTPEAIQLQLRLQKINVSISLEEYARLDLAPRKLSALVRASVHYYNTEEEIEHFCNTLQSIL